LKLTSPRRRKLRQITRSSCRYEPAPAGPRRCPSRTFLLMLPAQLHYPLPVLRGSGTRFTTTATTRAFGADAAKLKSLFAVGGVDFCKVASWDQPESVEKDLVAVADLRCGFGSRWSRLPATVQESPDVFDEHDYAFGASARRLLLQGVAPRETRLKYQLERYSILHLATHGYFQPEGMKSMWARGEGRRRQRRDSHGRTDEAPTRQAAWIYCRG
jgi:hypothetical protein